MKNVPIIDQKKYFRKWSGKGKYTPIRYCNYEVKHTYNDAREHVIAINVKRIKGGG